MYARLGTNAENSIESLITTPKKNKKNLESRFHSQVAAVTCHPYILVTYLSHLQLMPIDKMDLDYLYLFLISVMSGFSYSYKLTSIIVTTSLEIRNCYCSEFL